MLHPSASLAPAWTSHSTVPSVSVSAIPSQRWRHQAALRDGGGPAVPVPVIGHWALGYSWCRHGAVVHSCRRGSDANRAGRPRVAPGRRVRAFAPKTKLSDQKLEFLVSPEEMLDHM